jgi:hypothetical protein
MKPLVGFTSGPESSILAHGPETFGIHARIDAPGEGEFTGISQLPVVFKITYVVRIIQFFLHNRTKFLALYLEPILKSRGKRQHGVRPHGRRAVSEGPDPALVCGV